jgi:hypothetical protein
MTPEEREKLDRLCIAIKAEKNSAKLAELAKELSDFLQQRERDPEKPWMQEFV